MPLRIMLLKDVAAFFCVAVATATAGASVGQARYPVLGKDSALGALSTRRCDDDSTALCQREASARSAATTLRHVLHLRPVQTVADVENFRASSSVERGLSWEVGRLLMGNIFGGV